MSSVELYGLGPAITLTVVGCLVLLMEVTGIPVGARRLGPSRQTPWLTLSTRETPPRRFDDMWVSQDVYDAAVVGGQVCLDAQDGALGWPYARVIPCPLAPAAPAP